MSISWLAILIVVYLLVAKGPRMLAALKDMASQHGDDPGSGGTIAWYLSVWILGLGIGALATRLYWKSIPAGDYSFGGLVFMMSSLSLLALVIVIEALPVAGYLRAIATGETPSLSTELVLSMVAVAALCAVSTILPLRVGLRGLQALEL